MQNQELQLIDGLFNRLKEAEQQTTQRDSGAEAHIQNLLKAQPAAPYYMAQVILIQEAAMKQMDQRLKALEGQIEQLQHSKQNSGGFLSNLFGGSNSASQQPVRSARAQTPPPRPAAAGAGWNGSAQPGHGQPGYAPQGGAGGGGFLAGAMQTAVGVAGGMLMANAISDMFSDDASPDEIAQTLSEEPAADLAEAAPEADAGGWDDATADAGGWDTGADDFQQADFGGDDGGFFDGGDDDSFI